MAIPIRMDWEVRTGGNDLNGGGFVRLGAGTDYSQQPFAQLIDPAIASLGIGSVQLQSPTGGFTAAMVDNIIQLSTGTNLIPSWFRIVTYIDPNNITVDRAPDDGVGPLIGDTVGHVGGALATIGQLSNVCHLSTTGVYGSTDHRAWIEAGTYFITNLAVGPGGPFLQQGSFALFIEGYGAVRGDMARGAVQFINGIPGAGLVHMMNTINTRNQDMAWIINVEVDGAGDPLCNGIYHNSRGGSIRCDVHDCAGGIGLRGQFYVDCEAWGNFAGFSTGHAASCISHDNLDDGFQNIAARNCISYNNTARGFDGSGALHLVNCTAWGNGSDGFYNAISNAPQHMVDCLSVSNGGFGFRTNSGQMVYNCAGWGNLSGLQQNMVNPRIPQTAITQWYERLYLPSDPISPQPLTQLTGDPFVNAPTDFSLNNVAGAGAACRGAGTPAPGQLNPKSFGALEFVASGGGSTPIRRTARRLG